MRAGRQSTRGGLSTWALPRVLPGAYGTPRSARAGGASRVSRVSNVQLGFGAPVSGAWATPQNLASFAARAEAAGYASLWSFQRLPIPAAPTSRIRLGTPIINAPFAPPAYLAKQAASLDVLSGGRHDLGLGIGWMPEEFALTGATTPRRGARTAEFIEVLKTLWAPGGRAFSGEFYEVPAGVQAPLPVQPGGPPILLGGLARPALQRAGRIADGWITSSRTDLSRIRPLIGVARRG